MRWRWQRRSTGALSAEAAETVNIYSYRQPDLIKPVLDAFTEETGIETQLLFINKGLEERVKAEGPNSPVDLILSTDISRLVNAKEMGITQPVQSESCRAPSRPSTAMKRATGTDSPGVAGSSTPARIAWRRTKWIMPISPIRNGGRVCIRDGQHSYNLGLFGSLIERWGAEETEKWMTGLRDNLARRPERRRPGAGAGHLSGECDLALGNTYYVGLMKTNEKEPEQKDWAAATKIIFPTMGDMAPT